MTAFYDTCKGLIRSFVGQTPVEPPSMPPNEMEVDAEEQRHGLFWQCHFVVVRSEDLSERTAIELIDKLKLHDGEASMDTYGEADLSLEGITHIISSIADFPDYHRATDAMIPVVKPAWVEHSVARDRLVQPRQYNPDPRHFMSDVVACCADLPEGDADAIAGGILAMGGLFTSKLTSQVTHIVALSLEAEQCENALKRKLKIKIVLPHWFDDCLKLGRKIDEGPYLLPNPDILKSSHTKTPMTPGRGQVTGAVDPHPSGTAPPTPSETRKEQSVFKNKKVMLGKDLGIGSHLRGILEGVISTGGGKITPSIKQCDLFICKYRLGPDYKAASRAGKHVGNLAWLYYLITTDTWTSPLRRLLHYPVPKEPLTGFPGLKISLSNYTGEARTYLENLITATGAECTKTLKQDNTHLITAHVQSEKCAAAKDWGIEIVNHLWLEESYARWQIQPVTQSRYTHFPQRTNLGEVVGQTPIDRGVLEKQFFPADDDTEMDDAPAQGNAMEVKLRAPKPKKPAESKKQFEVHTPAASRFVHMGKENITPSSVSSRKSKDAAAAKLHEMTPDIALYEKEKKRVGGVVYGGRRKADEDRIDLSRKRSIDEMDLDDDSAEESEPKKIRKGLPPVSMQLLISGYKKWLEQPKVEDVDRSKLRAMGIQVTLEPSRATHLAAPNIVRTLKFVAAMAYAPVVISTDFIDACLEQDELLDPDAFALHDKTNEKKLGFSLQLSRERAKENRNQLLRNRAIYCLESVNGGVDAYDSIIRANGGICMTWRNRKGTMVPSRRAESDPDTDDEMQNEVYLLSSPAAGNEKLWQRFKQMVENSRKLPRIVSTDWLIETAMSQKLQPAERYAIKESL